MNKKINVMVETAIMIALAVVLSFVKVWSMPQGGTVSLTMLPLFVLAFRRGFFPALLGGVVYGAISIIFDGVIYHPMSILLDYTLAYGALAVAGLFKKNYLGIVLGTTVGTGLRYICSLLSGAVLFAQYAPEGQNPWIYSLGYNATYMIPELIICVVALVILYKSNKKIFLAAKED
ncbi:MAG: energy-coupled thiamine transporter ThiT [Clostridia bacterium]|nr:energy-coupled thiamine transporter ThiT [Clostridia bacterium]